MHSVRAIIAATVATAVLTTVPSLASAQMTAEAVGGRISAEFGVQILKTEETVTEDGRRAYRMTVMQDGGNSNSAFAVTTIVADAQTGELIPQFRHHRSGYSIPDAPSYAPDAENLRSSGGTVWR